jgi:hypothetical protein
MIAIPVGGGSGYNKVTTVAGGSWGPIELTGVTAGTYTVLATMNVKMGTTQQTVYSATSIITVP